MSKKTTNRFSPRNWRVALLGGALGTAVPFLLAPHPAQAKKAPAPKLELWPGQRVTVVLPLTLGPDWNADAELGRAIIPVLEPQLQNALIRTRKFSLTLPYRFDPILRRAVQEKRVAEALVNTYLEERTLQSVQPVLTAFSFDQPTMVADAKLEGLTVSGTPELPLVSVKVSAVLYQSGTGIFRRAVVTSESFGGKTPEARLTAAATQAFDSLAEQLIAPPASFELPIPVVPTPTPGPTSEATPASAAGPANVAPAAGLPPAVTVPSSQAPVASPNAMNSQPGAAFLPQLPPAQAPLGIAVPDRPAGAR